ncbi:MAG: GntR family transcriptional regulator [Cypionkella sp.]
MTATTDRPPNSLPPIGEPGLRKRPVRSPGAAPIYMQVAEILSDEIKARQGMYFALPSEGDLSREFGVSRVTIRQALKLLESRGVIYSEQGRGYFTTISRMKGVSGFHSFTSEVRRLGGIAASTLIGFATDVSLPDAFRSHLQVASAEPFIALRRARSIDGRPVALEDAYLPMAMYPRATREMFEDGSLYDRMTQGWGIVPAWADALFEPLAATDEVAQHLQIAPGAPVLAVWRVTATDTDQVCEYVRSIYRGDGFMLHINRYHL